MLQTHGGKCIKDYSYFSQRYWICDIWRQQTKAIWSTSPTSGIKWYQKVSCLWLITFDDCFLLSLIIMIDSYVDCLLMTILIEFWLSLMIVFSWFCFPELKFWSVSGRKNWNEKGFFFKRLYVLGFCYTDYYWNGQTINLVLQVSPSLLNSPLSSP